MELKLNKEQKINIVNTVCNAIDEYNKMMLEFKTNFINGVTGEEMKPTIYIGTIFNTIPKIYVMHNIYNTNMDIDNTTKIHYKLDTCDFDIIYNMYLLLLNEIHINKLKVLEELEETEKQVELNKQKYRELKNKRNDIA